MKTYILIPTGETTGTPQKAATYYLKTNSTQTIAWDLTGLNGDVTIEATLDELPSTDNYFTVHTIVGDTGTIDLAGRYTWIRATIANHSGAAVTSLTMVHP